MRRKMILALVLAIVSSTWMMSEASEWCMPSIRPETERWIITSGTFQAEGFPCEPEELCPPCLTIVLVTANKTFYLVTDDGQLINQLDTIPLGTKATVSGIPFSHGSYDYIQVSHIETDRTSQLPSLCDEWNVLHEPFSCDGIYCRLQTLIYRLTTDTLIQDVNYVKLMEQEGSNTYYKGAMREGTNRDIYYVPANSTHEYLLYAFNAQVGDTLSNLWVGGFGRDYQGVVQAISNGSPRIFTIGVKFGDESDDYLYPIRWIEGVGSPETPAGMAVVPDVPADIGVYTLLCAYKNGEQVYVSDMGEQYGCVYNYDPYAPSDTIPLFSYTGDDPGSSTVDPVDPNQVVATLQGDQLTIHEHSGVDVTYTLRHNAPAQMPSLHRAPQSDTFRDMVTLQITESGEYMLLLTNPSWGYNIFGRFNYMPQGIISVRSSSAPQKVLQNGQMIILRGEKMYTVTGQEVR